MCLGATNTSNVLIPLHFRAPVNYFSPWEWKYYSSNSMKQNSMHFFYRHYLLSRKKRHWKKRKGSNGDKQIHGVSFHPPLLSRIEFPIFLNFWIFVWFSLFSKNVSQFATFCKTLLLSSFFFSLPPSLKGEKRENGGLEGGGLF